jgi:O-antigen/teichoic acid export membrane protein
MLVVMLAALYTSRVILNTLGATDYGIYNVVGGIVTIVGFLNGALGASTSRFLTFALGEKNLQKQKDTFGAALNLHICVAILVLIVGETIGLWFFYEKMIIPMDRMTAAFWVYQFSIITTMVSFTQVPYNASLIAHEKMSIYAYVGLYEAFSRLAIAYLVVISPIDKLIFYGLLYLVNTVAVQVFYRWYTVRHFEECHFALVKDRALYKKLLSYGGWDLFGNLALVCQGQGVNLLLNVFFGPVVNTARAISFQIQGATSQFVSNFLTAVRPQVIKNYAEGNVHRMYTMTFYAAKFSYMLMLALVVPIIYEINFILNIWLGDAVPQDTAVFAVIVLMTYTWRTFHIAALMPYHAIGKIKTGNVTIGSLMIATLPIGYVLLKLGCPAYSVFLVIFAVEIISMFAIYWIIHRLEYFPYKYVFTKILIPCFFVTIVTIAVPTFITHFMEDGWWRFVLVGFTAEASLLLSALYIGLNKEERERVFSLVNGKIKKHSSYVPEK